MKKDRVVFISLFFIMIFFIFGMLVFSPSSEYSSLEKRKLAQFPEVSMENIFSGKFMKDFESYVNDHVWNRDSFVKISSYFKRCVGKTELNGVVLGKDGYLFSKFSVSDKENKQIYDNIGFINKFNERFSNVYFGLIPTSECILSSRLPNNYNGVSQIDFIKDINSELNLNIIDIYSNLLEHSSENIYFKTDHHWNMLGAYYGYQSICKGLGYEPILYDNYILEEIDNSFKGTTYSKINVFGENEILYKAVPKFDCKYEMILNENYKEVYNDLYFMKELSGIDKYSVYLGGNQSLVRVKSEYAKYDKKVLLIKDSYTHIMMPFMVDTFSEVVMIDLRHNNTFMQSFIEKEQFDEIVILYNTYNFKSENRFIFLSK